MSDSPQKITIKGIGWNQGRERNLTQSQLADKPFIDDAGIGPRVNESGESMRTIKGEKLDMEQGSLVGGRLHQGMDHQNLPPTGEPSLWLGSGRQNGWPVHSTGRGWPVSDRLVWPSCIGSQPSDCGPIEVVELVMEDGLHGQGGGW